jgi:Asp-tRNA(Asn)/Glu-tRNA(Gln) amidotransferase A subunit family amidase
MEHGGVAWLDAPALADLVRRGDLDPAAPVRDHLERIERLDPRLRAFVHVDRSAAACTGPLRGATLAVKDTQPVAGMPWTSGSRRWRDRVATADAAPVGRARAAGLAVLGTTHAPELAASIGTVSELFGATHNPWRPGVTPGGSSGGSAAAVAAGLCTLAFGDDMGGSIRIPAACCGVLGLRPSPDRVPDELPDPTRLSVRGPLARSVAGLRAAFAVMAGEAAAPASPGRPRVAVVTGSPLPVDPACAAARDRAAAALAAAGCEVCGGPAWDPEPVAAAYQVVRPASVAPLPGDPGEYGEAAGRLIRRGREVGAAAYLAALQSGLAAAARLRDVLGGADALLTPTLGLAPMPIDRVPAFLEDAWTAYTQFVLPVSFAGLPAVSVPAGRHAGLPVGVQLVGRPGGEWALLDLAERLEATPGFGFERPPGWD